jgi:hypothetical protein
MDLKSNLPGYEDTLPVSFHSETLPHLLVFKDIAALMPFVQDIAAFTLLCQK